MEFFESTVEGQEGTGVDVTADAGQELPIAQPETGVEGTQVAAGPAVGGTAPDGVEKAFAARLAGATEKVRQEERDALIAEMYGASHGIKTYAEYQTAVEQTKKQAEIDRLVQENIPREYAEKLQKVDELERWKQDISAKEAKTQTEQTQRARNSAMFTEFLTAFPEYGTEDKWGTIPKEVFAEAKKWADTNGQEGSRLSDAFTRHLYNQTVRQQQTQQANAANAGSSTGSVKGIDAPGVGFISRESYEQNKGNQDWMMKNFDIIKKSMGRWK